MSSDLAAASLQNVQIHPPLGTLIADSSTDSGERLSAGDTEPQDFLRFWLNHASAPQSVPELFCLQDLRGLYPKHSVALSEDPAIDILSFPNAKFTVVNEASLTESLQFTASPRVSTLPHSLKENVKFGVYKTQWQEYTFILHVLSYEFPLRGVKRLSFLLHDGLIGPLREFLLAVGAWSNDIHEEILVFNMGHWSKSKELWTEVQKANWKDVILDTAFKEKLQQDVSGFFASKDLYTELSIPWKRGLILYGPPGNGKTISLKAVLKTCGNEGLPLLYVKSFKSHQGDEFTIGIVFQKARHLAPCVVVLEDLDSLINDGNRSFFLNQLDGLEGNDGLLLVGTTNHFERLDAGISSRPSRFDRKFLFKDPNFEERKLYAEYWQKKLSQNQAIDFPTSLIDELANWTDHFSFAYLKEVFVSSLVVLAGLTQVKAPFAEVLKSQVEVLQEELRKPQAARENAASASLGATIIAGPTFGRPQATMLATPI
ncbi:P-loop containing nucleoside triphosphate hydrolase protein [Crepidotus variabilis]|uniref:P-loop containing nucleoside triphosphate hydrolase protein n=1 Tax=Crepidotus variabilis TaxID=179855 RepID=A0A9P6JIA7_9AGAR|nr:P-loop containing nucleoside triphosphate hydrolase protein [Crepidotus variabilis]